MAETIEPITIRGRYFWKGGERFLLRGVVYQLGRGRGNGHSPVSDPLADERLEYVEKSLPLFKELGLNTLFIYSIDNTKNHDAAMKLLEKAGIYVLICLSTPRCCIARNAPNESYKSGLLQQYFVTIDCMAAYPNTLGLITANGLVHSVASTQAASVVRAVTRDVKEVHGACEPCLGPENFASWRGDQNEALDFFCYNEYAWCGKSSMEISGYSRMVQNFSQSHLPIFFSEYGSNTIDPRVFHETRAIYSPEMTGVFSGGLVYEFFEGINRYGLVKADGNGVLTRLQDFHNLRDSLQSCRDAEPNTLADWSTIQLPKANLPRLPEPGPRWQATLRIPESPLDWDETAARLEEGEWVDVEREIQNLAMDELADSMWQRFRIDGTGPRWD
ncbi:glycolipid anchored surface protein [Xylariales sp. AK1849]|nr:glycolipid anchored surface protein [Xylariales sp. AK1849]